MIFNSYKNYIPYIPAFFVYVGTGVIAIGLATNMGVMQALGSAISGIGAFWSVHQQLLAASENQQLTKKIIRLQDDLHGQITGGESFCYAYPLFGMSPPNTFIWLIIHQGQFPLSDVSVRIHNCDEPIDTTNPLISANNLNLGTLLPGLATQSNRIFSGSENGRYNLFFVAKNGQWTQEIRWKMLPNELAVANRVRKHGRGIEDPLLLQVSPNYSVVEKDNAWL